MSERQVRGILKKGGERIFAFTESGEEYQGRAFFSRDTGISYFLLWVNDELAAITSDSTNPELASISGIAGTNDELPHQDGFGRLKQPFTGPATEIAGIDFSEMKPRFRPRTLKQELAALWMWHPIIIMSLPFTIPSLSWGNVVYSQMYGLRLGMSWKAVLWRAGKPGKTLGDAEDYQIWVYERTTVATEGDTITVSVGLREGHVAWLRYGYNAAEDQSRHAKDP